MATVNIKTYAPNSIRRFTVNTDTTYEEFESLIKQVYPSENTSFIYQYIDDEEDLISFSTQHEWENALSTYVESKSKLLRIKVKPVVNAVPRPQSQSQQQSRPRCVGFGPFGFPVFVRPQEQTQESNDDKIGQRFAPLLKNLFGIDVEFDNNHPKTEEKKSQQTETQEQSKPKQDEKELNFEGIAPILKSLFGVDVEFHHEKTKAEEKKQETQQQEKVEETQPKEDVVEEIIINDDEPDSEEIVTAPAVEEKKEEPKQVATEAKAETPVQKYDAELETLKIMGFNNEALNRHLLNTFKGDLSKVTNALVQVSNYKTK